MNIILGCGITGLIASQLIKNCIVLERSDIVASDFLDDSFPKFLHNNEIIRELYTALNIQPITKQFKIGIYESPMCDFYDNDIDKKKAYEKYCIKKYGKIVEDKMNGFLANSVPSYISNKQQLIDTMYKTNQSKIFLHSEIKNIDLTEHSVLTNDKKFFYDNLISTIPIDIFNKLASAEIKNIKYLTINVVVAFLSTPILDLDFIYVPDSNYSFHRINCSADRRKIVFEFAKQPSIEDCQRFLKDSKIESIDIKTFSFPITDEKVTLKNVYFLGRFSEGQYKLKVEDIIDAARQISKNV